ncbi:MAG: GNAT family N-acetyltransferase [Bacillota bacterium]
MAVNIVSLGPNDLESAAVYCAGRSNAALAEGIQAKTTWLREAYAGGLRVTLATVDNEEAGLIEYGPAEVSPRGLSAPGHWVINCLWVHSRYRQMGVASALLASVVGEAREAHRQTGRPRGIVSLTGQRTWVPGPRVFGKTGFHKVELSESDRNFGLVAVSFRGTAITGDSSSPGAGPIVVPPPSPEHLKEGAITFAWHPQCPHNTRMASDVGQVCADIGLPYNEVRLAGSAFPRSPFGTCDLYWGGRLIAWHPLNEPSLRKLLETCKR